MTNVALHNVGLAAAYILGAKLCQSFAIDPGNVTPIWISSGISFIWVYHQGYRVLPGVFLGAFIGNVSAYLFDTGALPIELSLGAGVMNGIGDALCIFIGVWIMRRFAGQQPICASIKTATIFIIGPVILGSGVSALFGVTGLWIAGLVPTEAYSNVFITWTIGDFMGILLLVPILESLLIRKLKPIYQATDDIIETVLFLALVAVLIVVAVQKYGSFTSHLAIYGLAPLLTIYSVRQQEIKVTLAAFFVGVLTLTSVATLAPPMVANLNVFILEFQLILFSLIATMLLIASSVNNIKGLSEKINQDKSMFLANMSHEIRTPMTGVLGLTELLLKTPLNSPQQEILSNISTSGKMLRQIINDVLDQSKINAGKLEINEQAFELNKSPELATAVFQTKAEDKGLELNVHLAADLPSHVLGDEHRINQVLFNFVSNAIKFTESGAVDIHLRKKHGMIEFSVEDTGMGIDEHALTGLFNPFEQANKSITRSHGGTGLGLSISKNLVELMRGEIGVESRLNSGSKFWFRLPLESALSQDLDQSEAQTVEHRKRSLEILVAEDVEINQIVLESLLTDAGHQCTLASDGEEAVIKFQEQSFDLVLMDIRMPNVDGIEALKRIRALESEGSHVPIIAVTADVAEGHVKDFLESGFNAVAHKPLEPEKLFAAIDKHTRRVRPYCSH